MTLAMNAPSFARQQQQRHHLPLSLLSLLLVVQLFLLPRSTNAILPTAAIDIHLPDTNAIITLLASQASFGGQVARYNQRQLPTGASSSGSANDAITNNNGVGVIPSFSPQDDVYLCNEAEGMVDYSSSNGIDKSSLYSQSAILVPRGLCSFEHKALSAQRLGASAIIIYGSLSSRYALNYTNSTNTTADAADADADENNKEEDKEEGTVKNDAKTRDDYTIHDMIWPGDKYDYDCTFGRALIPSDEFSKLTFGMLPGGYDEVTNDGMLTGHGTENLCVKYDTNVASSSSSFGNKCESQRCLVTGRNVTTNNDDDNISGGGGSITKYEACCAWDLHIWLYSDSSIPKTMEDVTIPAVYVTMQEAAELLELIRGSSSSPGDPILLSIYERYRPEYNVSAVLIWAFGVFVAWISSYMSSSEIRRVSKAIEIQRELKVRMDTLDGNGGMARQTNNNVRRASLEVEEPSGGSADERTIYQSDNLSSASNAAIAAIAIQQSGGVSHQEESLELTAAHAAGFLVMASTSLLILFFFKIYNVVKIMYAFGCSGAFAQMIVHPGFIALCRK